MGIGFVFFSRGMPSNGIVGGNVRFSEAEDLEMFAKNIENDFQEALRILK